MSDVFTVLIRGVYDEDKECYSAKISCPSQYKTIHCHVVGWYIPFDSTVVYNSQIAELKCINGLVIKNSCYENTNPLKTLAISNIKSLNLDCSQIEFECENFNNKVLEFSLRNENDEEITSPAGGVPGAVIVFDNPWTLVLKCKGYN
jgi:hypothetical protein